MHTKLVDRFIVQMIFNIPGFHVVPTANQILVCECVDEMLVVIGGNHAIRCRKLRHIGERFGVLSAQAAPNEGPGSKATVHGCQ